MFAGLLPEHNTNYIVMSTGFITCRFEVFGKVQGVSFRQYTHKQATNLELCGWCMNTAQGTVTGEMQGPKARSRNCAAVKPSH